MCADDMDCEGVLVCYNNLTWQENDPSAPRGCLCSSFYGWKGPNCLQFGPQTYLSLVLNLFIAIVAGLVAVQGIYMMIQLYRSGKGKVMWNATHVTRVCSLVTLLCLTGFRINGSLILLTPARNTDVNIGSASGIKYHRFSVIERVFTALTLIPFTIGVLNISVMWVEVAESYNRIAQVNQNGVSRLRLIIYTAEVIFVCITLVLLFLNMSYMIPVVAFPFFILMMAICYIGQLHLTTILTQRLKVSENSSESTVDNSSAFRFFNFRRLKGRNVLTPIEMRYQNLLYDIRLSARGLLFWLAICLVTGIAHAAMNISNWQNFSRPGHFSAIANSETFLLIGHLGCSCSIQYFCHRNMASIIKQNRENSQDTPVRRFSTRKGRDSDASFKTCVQESDIDLQGSSAGDSMVTLADRSKMGSVTNEDVQDGQGDQDDPPSSVARSSSQAAVVLS